jgi:hypothetical protein
MATGINQSNPTQAGKTLVDEATTGITTGSALGSRTAEKAGGDIGTSLESGIDASCGPVNKTATDLTDSCVPQGIESGADTAIDTANDAGQDISDSLMKGMEVKKKDVSKAFDVAGKGFGSAIKDGIGSTQKDVVSKSQQVVNAAGGVSGKDKGTSAGRSIIDGMIQGVNSGSGDLAAACERAVDKAIQAANDKAKTKSPSKVFAELGMNLMRGAAIGVDSGAHLLAEATARATDSSINLFEGAGMIAATRQMDRAMDGYSERVTEAIYDMNKAVEGSSPRAWMDDAPLAWDMRDAQAQLTIADHDDVPPIQIGDVILKEGDNGYAQARQLVDTMRGIAGQYRPM